MTIQVRVKLFATLARSLVDVKSGIPFQVVLADGADVADLIRRLKLPPQEVKLVFVNGRACPMQRVLEADDEIGLFPPIGGG